VRGFLTGVAVSSLVAVGAGCGSKTHARNVAQVTIAPASDDASPALYASCMRAHGVPRFPDLTGARDEQITAPRGVDARSSQFRAAQRACESRLPGGGPVQTDADLAAEREAVAQALALSVCMRAHGLPRFPDPASASAGGGIQLPEGLDPRSPRFQRAQAACARLQSKSAGTK
jgi:hypothetical protein